MTAAAPRIAGLRALAAAALALGCGQPAVKQPRFDDRPACAGAYGPIEDAGTLGAGLTEVSGIAASPTTPGVLWMIVDGGQQPTPLLDRGARAVVGQRHPRGEGEVRGPHGVVLFATELAAEASVVLAMTPARDDRVDVKLVDRPREAIPGRRIIGRAFAEQQQHDRGVVIAVAHVGDACR